MWRGGWAGRFLHALTIAGLLWLGACAGPPAASPALAGTAWVLAEIDGRPPLDGTHINLRFDSQRADGFAGCNSFGGDYIAEGDGILSFGMLAITVMACPEPEGVMEQESVFVQALAGTREYSLAGDRLELTDAQGVVRLAFSRQPERSGDPGALVGTRWRLAQWDAGPIPDQAEFTLTFTPDSIEGHAGCRDYTGTYQASRADLHVGFMSMVQAEADCPEALLALEGEFTTRLGWVQEFQLAPGRLELFTLRGETLVFEALP